MNQINVYTASKLDHAQLWRDLSVHEDWNHVHFTARWPYMVLCEHHAEDPVVRASHFWRHDFADVQRSDLVLVYGVEGEKLRGALVEAGIALGMGKRVMVVGKHPDYGSWQYHPNVLRKVSLDNARISLHSIANGL